MDIQTIYNQRLNRVNQATALKEPDRVPFVPFINNYYINLSDKTMYDAMTDPRCIKKGFLKFMNWMEPDLLDAPLIFPLGPLEGTGFTQGRWPGPYWNLPDDTPYQYIDKEYMDEDGYEEFLKDPSRFIMHTLLPQKHKSLAGLKKIEPYMLTDSAIYVFTPFGDPEVRAALQSLIDAGEQIDAFRKLTAEVKELGPQNGFPLFGTASCMAPFDEFADHVRGILGTCMDCLTCPDELKEALDRWADVTVPVKVKGAKASGSQYITMTLHCGVDSFMSVENYEKFYWPGLRRVITSLIDEGLTPLVFCEGKYYSRLNILKDVPKGKVVYLFEETDFAAAKKILGDTACIAGGMPTSLLMNATPQEVSDYTKKLIDTCAPGGGFIMSNSHSLDMAKPENMDAWKETLFTYGKY